MSEQAESVVGISRAELRGCRLDWVEIDRVLQQTDLMVAHNAAFDRPFLEHLNPAFAELPWACSLTNINWRSEEGLPQASIDFLLSHYGAPPSNGTPESDCGALAYLLAQPLPRSPCTGFTRLIQGAVAVAVECVLGADEKETKPAIEVLSRLGFQRRGMRWRADCANPAAAERLECELIDHAVGNAAFAGLGMWRVDALSRFTKRTGPLTKR
jgi:DNA polymerase-3 subunit epsilon